MARSTRSRVLQGVCALVLVAGVFAGGVALGRSGREARTSPAPKQARIYVYGDSLVAQSEQYFIQVGRAFRLAVTTHAFPGTAPCDWLPVMDRDLAHNRPDAVILSFAGNNFGTCMRDAAGHPLTGQPFLDKYRKDIGAAIAIVKRAQRPVILAASPASSTGADVWKSLDALYRSESAADPTVAYVDGGILIAPYGAYQASAPCLPFELNLTVHGQAVCHSDSVTVRAPDGRHLCNDPPQSSQTDGGRCVTYSSGAVRFALTLLATAKLDLDLHGPTTRPARRA